MNEVEKAISRVNTAKKRYEQLLLLKEKENKLLIKKYIEEETFSSNHIEGNSYSLDDTHFLLETGISPSGKKWKETIEIMNINKAMKFIYNVSDSNLLITEMLIQKLHLYTVRGTLDDIEDEGNYKRSRNWLSHVNVSTVQATPGHMKKLVEWYSKYWNKFSMEDIVKFI